MEPAFSHLCGVLQERSPHGAHGGVRGDFTSIVSANVAIATPNLAGAAGQKKKAMQGAGPCMTLKSLARPDRRMISPPATLVACSFSRPDLLDPWGGRQL